MAEYENRQYIGSKVFPDNKKKRVMRMPGSNDGSTPVAAPSSPGMDSSSPYSVSKSSYYTLGLLTIVYSFNFTDRQLLAILQESIKTDLVLSDSQLVF